MTNAATPNETQASEVAIREAFSQSFSLRTLRTFGSRVRASAGDALATSALAPRAHIGLLGSVCLLFLLSPWVGTGTNAALTLLVGLFLGLSWLGGRASEILPHRLDLIVLAFVAAHVVSIGFSPFLLPSLKGGAKMLVFWLAYVGFRFAMPQRAQSLWVLGALVLTAGLQSTYGVFQWVVGVEPLANWEDPEALNPLTRVYGSLLNPNLLAGYLMAVFPLACALAAVSRGILRIVALYTLCLAPLCIFFTYSRGAYLGTVASLLVFGAMSGVLLWPQLRRRKALLFGLLAASSAGVALVSWKIFTNAALLERIGSIFTLRGHSSNSFRMNVWTGVWQMVQDNWTLGIGVGNGAFRKMYSLYMVSGYEALGAYNIFLEVLAELGIIGLGIFLLLNAWALRTNWLTYRAGDRAARWVSIAVIAGLAGTWTMGLFDTVFFRPAVQLQYWLLLALTITWAQPSAHNIRVSPDPEK